MKGVAEGVVQALDAPVYHSKSGSVEEKAQVLQRWRDGAPPYIVATSAFGMGIDHAAVRWVVHTGVPWDLINFTQEVGRVGRDGAGGRSIILVPPGWTSVLADSSGRPLGAAEAAMQRYIRVSTCRVFELSTFLDGGGRPCTTTALLCDCCQNSGTVRLPNLLLWRVTRFKGRVQRRLNTTTRAIYGPGASSFDLRYGGRRVG